MADAARNKEWQQLSDWQAIYNRNDRAIVATGSALVLGEVASAHSVRASEQNEAPRSKFICAPSSNKFRAPQEGYQNVINLFASSFL